MLRLRISIAILAVVCMHTAARASLLGPSEDGTFTQKYTSTIGATPTDWEDCFLSFPKFDVTLGTLTSVTLELAGNFDSSIGVTNTNSKKAAQGTISVGLLFEVQVNGASLLASMQADAEPSAFALATSASKDLTLDGSADTLVAYNSAEVLALFTGTGDIALPAFTTTQTGAAFTGGNVNLSQATDAALTGSVTYTYTHAPEPGTCVLLTMGAVGMLAFGWNRRRN